MLKKISFLVVVVLTALFLVQPAKNPAHAAVLNWEPMVNGTFTGNRAAGFGDTNNALAISMATLGDYVYVSNANAITGTEIWRSNNGTDWAQVNNDGFGVAGAGDSYAVLAVFNGNLYAFNYLDADDHVHVYRYNNSLAWDERPTIDDLTRPSFATVYDNRLYVGLQTAAIASAVYRSADGSIWESSNSDGFGVPDNRIIYSMTTYNNRLYAGTLNLDAGGQIWYYDGATWTQGNVSGIDNVENIAIGTLTSFNNVLYATTINTTTGVEVWKSSGGGTTDWEIVSDLGFTQGNGTSYTFDSRVFKNKLYIGAGSINDNTARVFRTSNGTSWEQVNTDGFGYNDNYTVMFSILGDYLYAGTGTVPPAPMTTEVYRYYEPTEALPATGYDSPLNAYILDALM